MSPDTAIEFTEALALLPIKSLLMTLVAAALAIYVSSQMRATIRRYVMWRRALKRQATEGDWVMLRDQNQWRLVSVEFREVLFSRSEETSPGSGRTRTFSKTLPTEEYAVMELTKITVNGGLQ